MNRSEQLAHELARPKLSQSWPPHPWLGRVPSSEKVRVWYVWPLISQLYTQPWPSAVWRHSMSNVLCSTPDCLSPLPRHLAFVHRTSLECLGLTGVRINAWILPPPKVKTPRLQRPVVQESEQIEQTTLLSKRFISHAAHVVLLNRYEIWMHNEGAFFIAWSRRLGVGQNIHYNR